MDKDKQPQAPSPYKARRKTDLRSTARKDGPEVKQKKSKQSIDCATGRSRSSTSSTESDEPEATPAVKFFKKKMQAQKPSLLEVSDSKSDDDDRPPFTSEFSVDRTSGMKKGGEGLGAMPLIDLSNEPSYHGLMPREDIELLLQKQGDFLVRKTDLNSKVRIVISVRWDDSYRHILVRRSPEGFWFLKEDNKFENISELITYYKSKKLTVTPEGTRIKHPVNRQSWELSHDAIRIGQQLGEGAFGQVYKGDMRIDAKRTVPVAVKTLHKIAASKADRQQFITEARVMRKLRHRHIVSLFGVCAQEMPIMLVMELLPGGSLLKRLRSQGHALSLAEHIRFCLDASKGMKFLEKNAVIHRDVAARNCLLGSKDDVKVSDFGLGLIATTVKGTTQKMPIKWLAPETLSAQIFTLKSDVWSFGVLLWEIFADGVEPYPHMTAGDMRQAVLKKKHRMEPPYGTPFGIRQLMTELWNHNPEERPGFTYISKQLVNALDALKT